MSPLGYRQRRGGMGRAGRLRSSGPTIRPTYTLKIGCVKEIEQGNVIIESFCGKPISLTQKSVLGDIAPDDIVQITQDSPGYLVGTAVTRIQNIIFGAVDQVDTDTVKIVVDMFEDKRRVLVMLKDKYENYSKAVLDQRIKIYTNKKGELYIEPV